MSRSWAFKALITDLPLLYQPEETNQYELNIDGEVATLYVREWTSESSEWSYDTHELKDRRVAQFDRHEIIDVVVQEGSPSIGNAVIWGVLGGLVGGRIFVVVSLHNGCSLSFWSGRRTVKTRERSARIAGEIKQAAGVLDSQRQDRVAQTHERASDTKECPFCAETIKAKAIKCRYCGSDLTESS